MKAAEHKRNAAWKELLAKIEEAPPAKIAADMMNLTVCLQYWGALLSNARIVRYLEKYQPDNLKMLKDVMRECTRRHCRNYGQSAAIQAAIATF